MSDTLFDPDPATVTAHAGPGHLLIVVHGTPKTQGSKTPRAVFRTDKATGAKIYTGQAVAVDGKTGKARDAMKSWRSLVTDTAKDAFAGHERILDPVGLRLTFTVDRPKGHFGTGRNASVLKPSADRWPTGGGDLDKLHRAVGDSLKDAGIYKDDRQIVSSHLDKVFIRWQPGVPVVLPIANFHPLILCGAADTDALTVPGVVIRLWRMG